MSTPGTFTEHGSHEVWVEARKFELGISRPTSNTVTLTISRQVAAPETGSVIDGAVLILGTTVLSQQNFPNDGSRYPNASTVWNDPASDKIGNAQVVGFWSAMNGSPFPTGAISADGTTETFAVTITGTDPNAIYYAAVHGCSNILSYYSLGVQSYPLDANQVTQDVSTYAGSIPSYPSAPVSPTPGTVYFDKTLNLVQYWDDTRSVWVPSRSDSIVSGDYNPGTPGQTYILSGNIVKVFDGLNWTVATPTNLQFKVGAAWIPFGVCTSNTFPPTAPALGDLFYNFTSQRATYFDGNDWQTPTGSSALFTTNTALIPAFVTPTTFEAADLITPYIGQLFYNISQHVLNVWSGSTWIQANIDQQGNAISDKIGIGSNGSYQARLQLINVIKGQLGWPATCIELTEEQFNIALDDALDTYRQLSIGAYELRYITFQLLADQNVYYLNSPADRTDAIVQVQKVHRLNLLGINSGGPNNVNGQYWAQQFLGAAYGGGADLLSSHLVSQWAEEFTKVFAGDIPFLWNEARRELHLLRAIRSDEKVILEVELERSEQELISDRWCKQFLQNWSLAQCKSYLGLIRSKYSSGTPGAAGTIQLNGETLLAEARQDMDELHQQLIDYEFQNANHGNTAFLMA